MASESAASSQPQPPRSASVVTAVSSSVGSDSRPSKRLRPTTPKLKDSAYNAVVLDIEGTTTPLSFVADVLFPWAREHVSDYLRQHWHDDDVQRDLRLLQTQCREDVAAGLPGAVEVPDGDLSAFGSDAHDAVVRNVLWQMDGNRKTTALKSLQGHLWKQGYEAGELRATVYRDVLSALEAWRAAEVPVFIYSSGSIEAQKLLFGYSTEGDLLEYISGHFDTTIGSKVEAASYGRIAAAIAESLGNRAPRIVFATDNLKEAEAAEAAADGHWLPVIAVRPGNAECGAHDLPTVRELTELL